MGAPIRSSTEITQIINKSQHALGDLGISLVAQAKRGIDSTDPNFRDEMYRLKFIRALLHNILDDNADVRLYYTASANLKKFNGILDGLLQLSGLSDGPGINIIGIRRNLLFFTGSGAGGGSGGPANPGGTTFQNLQVDAPGENIDTFDANMSSFAFYIYSVLGANPGEGARTGTIIATWNGSNTPKYAETRTPDDGGITSPISFIVELNAGQIELNAVTSTDGWVVKGVRILFQNISFVNPVGPLPVGGTTGQILRKASNADYDATWQSLIWTMLTDVTASLAEINRVAGVTSPIQTQLDAIVAAFLLKAGGTMSGDIAMGGHKITGSAAATTNGDLVRFEQLAALVPAGVIVMWSGSVAPSGWALCNGSGGTPDLRSKFIVGYNPGDPDYSTIGNTGGEKTHLLLAAESGQKAITLANYFHVGTASQWAGGITDGVTVGPEGVPGENATTPHENRPPYYTLAYIVKL